VIRIDDFNDKPEWKNYNVNTAVSIIGHTKADAFYQKKVITSDRTCKYHLNAYMYDSRKYTQYGSVAWVFNAYFYRNEDFWWVCDLEHADSIEQAEVFFEEMFTLMRCIPDPHND